MALSCSTLKPIGIRHAFTAAGNRAVAAAVRLPVQRQQRRQVAASALPLELLAAAGDVEAPIGVPLVAALVVTAAVTFAVPAYLSRGQQAADKIFSAKEKAPLDKGRKTAKGKAATTKGKTARR